MRRVRNVLMGLGLLWCGLIVAILGQRHTADEMTTLARTAARWWLQGRQCSEPAADAVALPPGIRSVVQLDAHRELRWARGAPLRFAAWTPVWDQALRTGTVVERARGGGEWHMAIVQFGEPSSLPLGYVGLHFDAALLPFDAAWPAWGLGVAGLFLSAAYLWWPRRRQLPRSASTTASCPGTAVAMPHGVEPSEWPSEYASILCVADTVSAPVIVCDAQWRCAGANAAARREAIQEQMHLFDWSRPLPWGDVLVQTVRAVVLPGPRSTHVATETVSLSVARLDRGSRVAGYWISWEDANQPAGASASEGSSVTQHDVTPVRGATRRSRRQWPALLLCGLLTGTSVATAHTSTAPQPPEQQLLRWLEHEARIAQQHGRITTAIVRYREVAWLCPSCPVVPIAVQHLEAIPRVAPAHPAHR